MMGIIRTLLAIRTSSAANLFIFYFRKLPLIGKLLPESAYANLPIKRAAAALVFIASIVWGFASRFLYLGLMVYWPVSAYGQSLPEEDRLLLFFHIFILLSFAVAAVSQAYMLAPQRIKYIAVKLMRMPADRFMRASLGHRYLTFFVYLLPAAIVFASLLGATALQIAMMTVTVTLWRVFSEYLHLILFKKTGHVLVKNNLIVWLTIGIGYAAAYAPLFLQAAPMTGTALFYWPALGPFAALGLYAAIRLARYPDYYGVVDAAAKKDDPLMDIGRMVQEAEKSQLKTDDEVSPATADTGGKYNRLEDYAYLNALFFARHRKTVAQPANKRMAIVGALAAAGTAFALFSPQPEALLNVAFVFPYMALFMYFFSSGERVCKAMFFNCDLSLLRYGFYRRDANRHFRIRLGKLVGLNLRIAAAIGAAATLVTVAAGGSALESDLLMLWAYALSLSVLFSVHHLFMYYIFQPYTTELNAKNPIFHVFNTLFPMCCGFSIGLRAEPYIFAVAAAILMLAYLVAAFVLVRRFGPRTFRLK
ncbi:hypothetical protein ACF3MZ_26335 [Paenibacillaceae bacterium WGS1546]|uniref:hypothetical protein n=1 Tax=Cohnella sp. WGS1546 TaxID=3366810 RepID=UPI00372D26C5